MAGTGTSWVVVELLSSVRSPDLGTWRCPVPHWVAAVVSPLLQSRWPRLSLEGGLTSLPEVWCCCTSSAASCLMSDSGVLLPCWTLAIFFYNFSALLIKCSSLLQGGHIHSSSVLHGVVCVSTVIHTARSNSSSSICTRFLLPHPHSTLPPDSVTKFEAQK